MKPMFQAFVGRFLIPYEKQDREKITQVIDNYENLFDENKGGGVERRKKVYTNMVNDYYDLVTDFYEYGWGKSFHFAIRHDGEAFATAIARHEMYLALKMKLEPGMNVLDVGCGVGGPLREIARFSGATVTGINNNDYQIARGVMHTQRASLTSLCKYVKGDFMHMPFENGAFDAAYAIEATCHAPDKVGVYSEIFRVLKPGAYFATYEWCMTEKFDANNTQHAQIKHIILLGNALADLLTTKEVPEALKAAGFEVMDSKDIALTADQFNAHPWYSPLEPKWTPSGFQFTPTGRWFIQKSLNALESIRLLPSGTARTSKSLSDGGQALVDAGRLGIFTPMYFVLARKPLNAK